MEIPNNASVLPAALSCPRDPMVAGKDRAEYHVEIPDVFGELTGVIHSRDTLGILEHFREYARAKEDDIDRPGGVVAPEFGAVVGCEDGDVVPSFGQAPGYPDHHVLGAAFAGKRGMYDCDLHILRSYCRPTCQK